MQLTHHHQWRHIKANEQSGYTKWQVIFTVNINNIVLIVLIAFQ